MRVTRRDVAKRANVSAQTVSYILNGTRQFSEEITARVNKAVEELNYQPNMIAKSLVTKKTKTVCLIVEDIRNPIWGEIVRGFEHAASNHDYFVSLIDGKCDFKNLARNIIARDFDGVFITLIAGDDMQDFASKVLKAGIKIVLGNPITLNSDFQDVPYVGIDLDSGMRMVVNYLYQNGHRQITYLSGLEKDMPFDSRYSAFVSEMHLLGLDVNVIENVYPFDTTAESGYMLGQKLLEQASLPTAVIATNDLMAMGFLECMKDKSISVPEQISLISFDNIFFSKYTTPPLTTLGFNRKEYGRKLFDCLLEMIETGESRQKLVDCELVVRESVRAI